MNKVYQYHIYYELNSCIIDSEAIIYFLNNMYMYSLLGVKYFYKLNLKYEILFSAGF